jgi:CheY-like chemotaxis protein
MPLASKQVLHKRLFIIDDDVEDQEIFMEAVKEVYPTIQCFTSTNGEEALDELEKNESVLPDLIFLDLNMPKLNGKQILREIKNRSTLSTIPVIMYSTSFAPRDIEEISQLGAAFHLLKPSRFDDLCHALAEILSRRWR